MTCCFSFFIRIVARPGRAKDSCSIRQFGGAGGINTFMNLHIASILHPMQNMVFTVDTGMLYTLLSLLHVANLPLLPSVLEFLRLESHKQDWSSRSFAHSVKECRKLKWH